MSTFWGKKTEFAALPQSDAEADLEAAPRRTSTSQRPWHWLWSPLVFIFGLAIGGYVGKGYVHNLDGRCIRHISEFSPLTKEVDITFSETHFNGSLFKLNAFRQEAGPEVDAAWESLGVDYRSAIVPAEMARDSGLTTSHVQVRPKYGGGFPANVEGLHHLHCLNLLRQSLYYNFEYYHKRGHGAFKNSDHVLQAHVTHCLDTLRQQLMCTVDIGMLGQVWWKKEDPQAYPDFNTRHTCRNFEAIRQWAEAHQAPEDPPDDYLAPPVSVDAVYASIP